jgi:glucokinase
MAFSDSPAFMNRCYLGIEIGGTKLQVVLGDGSSRIATRWRFNVDRDQGAAGIRRQIQTAVAGLGPSDRLDGVGAGFGGPVDWRTGRIRRSHHIEGWTGFELGQWLESLTQAPVRVENDANIAALGEAIHGAGRGSDPVFYVTLGSGVGGGLVVDGRIYHGASPGEAEIGHVRLDRTGTLVEDRCSGWAVDARIRSLKFDFPEAPLIRAIGNTVGGEARSLRAALDQNDPLAEQIVRETAGDLAFGLSHVTHLFHPETIVIGGGLSLVGEPLRAAVAEALPPFIMEAFLPGPKVVLAELGEDAVPAGALVLARSASD